MSATQRSRMKHRPKDIRVFICETCGMRQDAAKYKAKTLAGHEKVMWCCGCKAKRTFIQVDRLEDYQCIQQQTTPPTPATIVG